MLNALQASVLPLCSLCLCGEFSTFPFFKNEESLG